jgi:hypothetical protein
MSSALLAIASFGAEYGSGKETLQGHIEQTAELRLLRLEEAPDQLRSGDRVRCLA